MNKIAILLLLVITLSSCKSSQKIVTYESKTTVNDSNSIKTSSKSATPIDSKTIDLATVNLTPIDLSTIELLNTDLTTLAEIPKPIETQANRLIDYAFAFDGVRYKRGGTTLEGMDCSGLVVTTFDSENISLPRVSRDIALTGNSIDLTQVIKGDLLFFATRRNSRTISHVGIVTAAKEGFVEFIHASTSSGVIVSNMAEKYWNHAFIKARRVI